MSVAARKITVAIDGTSTELQDAARLAGESLKALLGVVADTSQASIEWGSRVIDSNIAVAASYEKVAGVARAAASVLVEAAVEVDDAAKMQTGAFTDVGAAASRASTKIAAAVDKQVMAVLAATDDIEQAAKVQGDAFAESADMASAASSDIVAAASRQSEAIVDSALTADDAIKFQIDAQAKLAASATAVSAEVAAASERESAAAKATTDSTVAASTRSSDAVAASGKKQAAAFGATGSGLVKTGKVTVESLLAIAAGSLYMSAKFESSTTRLLTQAGATEKQLKQLRTGVLDMAGAVGQTPEHLSEGLYHVVSSMNQVLPAATRTHEELKILRIAAEGAAIGNTSVEETTYALASAMNALHQHAGDAQHTMALLNAIVGSGDMTMSDLLAALKSGLIPTLQTYGVSVQSAGAALAVMGDQGMRGALAGTRLRMAISLIAAPSEKAAKILGALGMSAGEIHARTTGMSEALEKAGLTTTTMAHDLRQPDGIVVALRDLRKHLMDSGLTSEQAAAVFGRAFGGGRMSASIMLLADSVGRVGVKYTQTGHQINSFGGDWKKTQETLSFQAKQAEAEVEKLAITLGEDLTPYAEDALHVLEKTAEFFEHNRAAAQALADVIAGGLSLAVAAFTVNKLKKMVDMLSDAGGALKAAGHWLFTSGGNGSAAVGAAAEKEVSPIGAIEGGGLGIGGARSGPGLPGSMTNPVIVAQESGQYAGLGGEAAASGAVAGSEGEVKTAASEVTKGIPEATQAEAQATLFGAGVGREPAAQQELFPAAASEGKFTEMTKAPVMSPSEIFAAANPVVAEEGAGVLASVKSGMGSLVSGLMKGGVVAGVGLLGSQAVGSAIGGKTGKEVGSTLSSASIGAAIGTVIEPGLGTAIGGALGAAPGIINAFKAAHLESEAKHYTSGHGQHTQAQSVQEQVEKIIKREKDELNKTENNELKYTFKTGSEQDKHDKYIKESAQRKIGEAEGKGAKEYVLGGTKNPGLESIINNSKHELEKLSTVGRAGMVGFIKSMVQTLEKEERLPHDSLQHVFEQLKPLLQGVLPTEGAHSAKEFSAAFVSNIKTEEMLGKLSTTAKEINSNWAREFGLLPVTTNMTLTEVVSNTNTNMHKLTEGIKTGQVEGTKLTKQQMSEMKEEYAKLAPALHGYMGAAYETVVGSLTAIGKYTGPISAEASGKILAAYDDLPAGLKERLDKAGGAVEKGISKINKVTQAELKVLGYNPNITGTDKPQSNRPGPGGTYATGGLVQLGRPGEAGHDSIPLSVGAKNIVAAPGETVAVLTRHQRAEAEAGVPFSKVFANKTPNYMASGGIVSNGDFSKTQIEQLWDNAGGPRSEARTAAAIALAESGGSATVINPEGPEHAEGLWQIKGEDVPGNPLNPTISAENAVAKWRAAGGFSPWTTFTSGAYRKFLNSTGGSGGSSAAGELAAAIMAPHVGGSGVVSQIAQAALDKVASAANQTLEAAGAAVGGPSGAGGGSAGGGVAAAGTVIPRVSWNPLGKPIAKWIVPVLEWAHNQGWDGSVSSGYRTPSEQMTAANEYAARVGQPVSSLYAGGNPLNSNHLKTSYPGGAVDVEGSTDAQLIAMLPRYPGPQKMKGGNLGPGDPYHFSESGFAQGGLVHAASGLGPTKIVVTTKTSAQKTAIKEKTTKPKSQKTKLKASGKSDLSKKLGSLKYIPGLELLPESVAPFSKELEAYSNLSTLLGQIESDPQGVVLLDSDMQYLSGLRNSEHLQAGMPLTQAQDLYNTALSREGETPDLKLEGEYLKWAEGQADHRLLTSGQAGTLSAAARAANFGQGLTPGHPLMQIQQVIKEMEIGTLKSETKGVGGVVKTLSHTLAERKDRERRMEKLKKVEKRRSEHLKTDIERLETGSLKSKLAAAVNGVYQEERVVTAEEHKDALKESIAGVPPSKALPGNPERTKADERNLEAWKTEEAQVDRFLLQIRDPIKSKQETQQRAELALLKNKLTDELKPITESLTKLDSSEPLISIKGVLSEIKTIAKDDEESEAELAAISQGKLPSAQFNLEEIIRGLAESQIPREVPPSAAENTTLTEALEARNTLLSTEYAISQSQYGVLKNFEANVPHFEKGGPVLEDGLAYLHAEEHVVPKGGALVSNGGQPPIVHVHHETHVHGDAVGLIKTIDNRIAHPENVRVVSRYQGQRVQNFPGIARGR